MSVTVFETGRLLPAQEAVEFALEYGSVVLSGRAFEAQDEEEARGALEMIMAKYAPHLQAGTDYEPITPKDVLRTNVLRIDIHAWSGKEKKASADYPGAYWLMDVR